MGRAWARAVHLRVAARCHARARSARPRRGADLSAAGHSAHWCSGKDVGELGRVAVPVRKGGEGCGVVAAESRGGAVRGPLRAGTRARTQTPATTNFLLFTAFRANRGAQTSAGTGPEAINQQQSYTREE